jgi:hypothetical protein
MSVQAYEFAGDRPPPAVFEKRLKVQPCGDISRHVHPV